MRELHVVAVSEDGRHVVLASHKGAAGRAEFRVAMDDRLKAAIRGDLPRLGEHKAPESAVTPKEIQARLRAGESVEQIAAAAGVPAARVERFAGPVYSERERMVGGARAAVLARPRRGLSSLPLGDAVAEHLQDMAGYKPDSTTWSAKREESGRWLVQVSFVSRAKQRTAGWRYDPASKDVVAVDAWSAAIAHVEGGPTRRESAPGTPARRRAVVTPVPGRSVAAAPPELLDEQGSRRPVARPAPSPRPAAARPAVARAAVVRPVAARPEAARPVVARPVASRPVEDGARTAVAAGRPSALRARPAAGEARAGAPAAAVRAAGRAGSAKAGSARAGSARAGSAKAESATAGAARVAAPKRTSAKAKTAAAGPDARLAGGPAIEVQPEGSDAVTTAAATRTATPDAAAVETRGQDAGRPALDAPIPAAAAPGRPPTLRVVPPPAPEPDGEVEPDAADRADAPEAGDASGTGRPAPPRPAARRAAGGRASVPVWADVLLGAAARPAPGAEPGHD